MPTDATREPDPRAHPRVGERTGDGSDRHTPVLLSRVVELLAPVLSEPSSVLVDCTVGLGGHAEGLLRAAPAAQLVGLDRDPRALELAGERLASFGSRIRLRRAVYDELPAVLAELGVLEASAVLFDLGVSSLQLDTADRGFAYSVDAPLDMRMDPDQVLTAEQVVNGYPQDDLTRVLARYGQERYAGRIAAGIVRARDRRPLTSSAQLVDLVRAAIPAPARRQGGHPAKRTFQALRIEVNGELAALERAIPRALDALALGGRIAVISYHSLEDRIVKHALHAQSRPLDPPDLPVVTGAPRLHLLTRGAEGPGPAELAANPRSASARLRAAERTLVAA